MAKRKATARKAAKKSPAKVTSLTARRQEAVDIAKFIDAHGGKLAPFRSYGAAQQVRPPSTSPAAPDRA